MLAYMMLVQGLVGFYEGVKSMDSTSGTAISGLVYFIFFFFV